MNNTVERSLDLAVRIQQIPAPTFDEGPRARFVQELFVQEGLPDVSTDAVGNVYARLPGRGDARPLVVSAHLDTVFPASTPLTCTRREDRLYGPGIGDNSLGVAALFGLIWSLRERHARPAGDIWLAANVGEEGLGNLRGIAAVADRFGADVTGYLVIEGTALGHIYHRAIAVQRYRVTVRTAGGHSWSDYEQPSAIHELARIVTQLTGLPVPSSPRSSLNVGIISGGTGVNVVAPQAALELDIRSESAATLDELELDIRSESAATLDELFRRVKETVASADREGVSASIEEIGRRPAGQLSEDHPLVRLAGQCLAEQGWQASFTSGSTDANIPLSRGYPALVLGVTTGGGAHTVQEYIDIPPIEKGLAQLACFAERAFGARG